MVKLGHLALSFVHFQLIEPLGMPKVPLPQPSQRPIAVGFSVRALVQAITACTTHPPIAADCFGDHDCRLSAHRIIPLQPRGDGHSRCKHLLQELQAGGATADSPVLLGGGAENWLELVAMLHSNFTLLGPTEPQLRQLRNLAYWQACAAVSGMAFPETIWERPPASEGWLLKPRHGAGGHAIQRAAGQGGEKSSHYYQRHVVGRALGAYCIVHSDGQVELLGASESLSAAQWPGPSEFIYRGSMGPIALTSEQRTQIVELCQVIQASSGCRGWLQLDFIEDAAGKLWLLELNPRWAAGMEILFLAGINPVAHHLLAWGQALDTAIANPNDTRQPATPASHLSFAKGVVYADRELHLNQAMIERLHGLPRQSFADLPSLSLLPTGKEILVVAAGEPLLTVIASGSHASLLDQLIKLRHAALNIVE